MQILKTLNAQISETKKQLENQVQKLIEIRSTGDCDFQAEKACRELEYKRRGLVKAKNALNKYDQNRCLQAYHDHLAGNGANTIGDGNTNTGDALIAAGEYLVKGTSTFFCLSINF